MWNRVELKARGKQAFLKNYWKCVLVAFIMTLILGNGSSQNITGRASNNVSETISDITGNQVDFDYGYDFISEQIDYSSNSLYGFITSAIFGGIMIIIFVIALALSIFIYHPLAVGGYRFFLENTVENPSAGRLLYVFQNGIYGKVVVTMFLKSLYTFLWSLLFIIPGIVKSYEYRMVPYLLADAPEMSREDAFRISKELMDGEKMNAFILDLSFIGWEILSGFTCGILGLFYVRPYVQATNAELFVELKRQYFAKHTYADQNIIY